MLESLKNWHKRELADRMKEVGHCIPLNRNGTGVAGYQAVVDEYEFMLKQQKVVEDE
ncbi:hypothetical protein [Photobacterium nomapromontoriensis]|uniref:hypothetical protein n=1 Tax=Photobacterium nomapromontoriensis TaxID=2910237 RepID=UPI003D11720B